MVSGSGWEPRDGEGYRRDFELGETPRLSLTKLYGSWLCERMITSLPTQQRSPQG